MVTENNNPGYGYLCCKNNNISVNCYGMKQAEQLTNGDIRR